MWWFGCVPCKIDEFGSNGDTPCSFARRSAVDIGSFWPNMVPGGLPTVFFSLLYHLPRNILIWSGVKFRRLSWLASIQLELFDGPWWDGWNSIVSNFKWQHPLPPYSKTGPLSPGSVSVDFFREKNAFDHLTQKLGLEGSTYKMCLRALQRR